MLDIPFHFSHGKSYLFGGLVSDFFLGDMTVCIMPDKGKEGHALKWSVSMLNVKWPLLF